MQTQAPHRRAKSSPRRGARQRPAAERQSPARHDPATATRCFETHLRILLRKHRGRCVLIHGNRIIDVFDTYDAAVREGFRRYAGDGFLAREILDVKDDPIVSSVVTVAP